MCALVEEGDDARTSLRKPMLRRTHTHPYPHYQYPYPHYQYPYPHYQYPYRPIEPP